MLKAIVVELDGTYPYSRSPFVAVVLLITVSQYQGPLSTQPQHGQKCLDWGEEGKDKVHLIVDDEPPWVVAVGEGQAGGHFPGVPKGHMVCKGSSEEPVHLEGIPVTAIHGLVFCVGQFDDHQSVGLLGQQCSHSSPDPQFHGPPVVMRLLVCGGNAGASCVHYMCAPVQHYTLSGVHGHQRTHLIHGM